MIANAADIRQEMTPGHASVMLRACWMGVVPYSQALEMQRSLLEKRKAGVVHDTVLLLEHPSVFTLGRRTASDHVLADAETLRSIRTELIETDRGGEATYHGPGQLVVYPIISIRDARLGPVAYVRLLEQAVIESLLVYGIAGHRVVGKTGVWVGGEPGSRPADGEAPAGAKIAAIGVRISEGVAMHGYALNVSTDLSHFGYIVPCGMPSLSLASVASLGRRSPTVREVGENSVGQLARLLDRRVEWIAPGEI